MPLRLRDLSRRLNSAVQSRFMVFCSAPFVIVRTKTASFVRFIVAMNQSLPSSSFTGMPGNGRAGILTDLLRKLRLRSVRMQKCFRSSAMILSTRVECFRLPGAA